MVDRETTGVPEEHTGVATLDKEERTAVSDTEADTISAIDAAIAEVAATLDQKIREANAGPRETMLPEAARDAEVSHPITNTRTTRRIFNLGKGKNGNRGRN